MRFQRKDIPIFASLFRISLVILAVLILSGCSKEPNAELLSPESPILREREEKDEIFKIDPSSPIPAEDRARFQGLSYYPVNPQLRFQVRLNRYSGPKQVQLSTNTGEVRNGLRYGYFDFEVEGQTCRLQVYRLEDAPAGAGGALLFIPFRDSTSGEETYAAGRYIDLKENTSGVYDLDFNRAYNPSCAYSSGFSCPMPPSENILSVAIRAGEKNYLLAADH